LVACCRATPSGTKITVRVNTTFAPQNLFEEGQYAFFPSLEVTRLLVECGAKMNAMNSTANTPLHTAALPANFSQEVSSRPERDWFF
jgi:ankyrin repeat protein